MITAISLKGLDPCTQSGTCSEILGDLFFILPAAAKTHKSACLLACLLESYSATTPHEHPPPKKNSNIKINKNTGTQQTAPTRSPKLSTVSEILILLLLLLLQDLSSKTGSIFHKPTKEFFNLQVFLCHQNAERRGNRTTPLIGEARGWRQRRKHHTLTAATSIRCIEVRSNSMEPWCLLEYLPRRIWVRLFGPPPPVNSKILHSRFIVYTERAFACHMYANAHGRQINCSLCVANPCDQPATSSDFLFRISLYPPWEKPIFHTCIKSTLPYLFASPIY
jgi:hypothetical protein